MKSKSIIHIYLLAILAVILFSPAIWAAEESSHFGMRGLNEGLRNEKKKQQFLKLFSASGASWINAAVKWIEVEPRPPSGDKYHYDFSKIDKISSFCKKNNINANILIRSVSNWGTSVKEKKAHARKAGVYTDRSSRPLSNRLNEWDRFITTVVQRYPDIKYWQIESEPGNVYPPTNRTKKIGSQYWSGTPKDYAEHFLHTANLIKSVRPDARIVLAGFVSGSILKNPNKSYFKQTLDLISRIKKERGYAHEFDIVDCHSFGPLDKLPQVSKQAADALKRYGFDNKQIWITQTNAGWKNVSSILGKNYSDSALFRLLSQDIVKRYVTGFYNNFDKIFYAKFSDQQNSNDSKSERNKLFRSLGLVDGNDQAKPMYYTYKLMANKLEYFKSVTKINVPDCECYQFTFDKKGKNPVFVAWLVNENKKVIDFSLYVGKKDLKITSIITLTGETEPSIVTNSSDSILISSMPVFIE
jgi:hypothetical protein